MGNLAQYGVGILVFMIAFYDWGLLCALQFALFTDFIFNKLALIGGIGGNIIGIGLIVATQFGIAFPTWVVLSANILLLIGSIYFWVMNFKFRARRKAQREAKKLAKHNK